MRPLYAELIERETGRAVTAFMSTTHQDPDILAELFILESLFEGPGDLGEQAARRYRSP